MSEITRRTALSHLAAAFVAAGTIDRLAAAEAYQIVDQATGAGPYVPKALTGQQFRTLVRLTDLIIPIEDDRPGAVRAEVPAWIDTLLDVNDELKAQYVAGLSWMDSTMQARHGTDFATSTTWQQTALLDQIAYERNRSPELDPGIDFFILARRMTVDGFYTSPIGMRDIYQGNTPRQEFTTPQEAIDYVLARSPFN